MRCHVKNLDIANLTRWSPRHRNLGDSYVFVGAQSPTIGWRISSSS